MEVKIGVQNVAREILLESSESAEEVSDAVTRAVGDGKPLQLKDDRGRLLIVPVQTLAYVEIGAEESRRVGFGAL